MRVLDLFSGIGGFSLGLEATGGFETVAFCEIEEYPRRVLKRHWPDVPIYEDVRELSRERLDSDAVGPIEVVCGGFPCQDLSLAGSCAGIEGERSGLWGEMCRLISEIRPRFALMENVTNLLAGGNGAWFGRVLSDLAAVGYDAEWNCIPAAYVGAPHIRDRVWIVAYPNESHGVLRPWEAGAVSGWAWWPEFSRIPWGATEPKVLRVADGLSCGMDRDRTGSLGNAVVPQIPAMIGLAILRGLNAVPARS